MTNPLFDYLGDLFGREEEKLKKLETDIRRQIRVDEMVEVLRIDLMSCKSNQELSDCIFKHLEILHNDPRLFSHVNKTKKRIDNLNRTRIENWSMN